MNSNPIPGFRFHDENTELLTVSRITENGNSFRAGNFAFTLDEDVPLTRKVQVGDQVRVFFRNANTCSIDGIVVVSLVPQEQHHNERLLPVIHTREAQSSAVNTENETIMEEVA